MTDGAKASLLFGGAALLFWWWFHDQRQAAPGASGDDGLISPTINPDTPVVTQYNVPGLTIDSLPPLAAVPMGSNLQARPRLLELPWSNPRAPIASCGKRPRQQHDCACGGSDPRPIVRSNQRMIFPDQASLSSALEQQPAFQKQVAATLEVAAGAA